MSLEERKRVFMHEISVYQLRREVKTLLIKSMESAYSEGYRNCATEVRDIIWPTEGDNEKKAQWLSNLVDLIDELVVSKEMDPLPKSQYDTTPSEPEPEKKPEPVRCNSCRGTVFYKDSKGIKFCVGCGRNR